jgi:hypothetical protein
MKKIVMATLAVLSAVVIIISFFMPWAKASTSATRVAKSVKQGAGGALQGTSLGEKVMTYFDVATQAISDMGDIKVKTIVRGCDIPTLVSKKSSNVAISLVQVYAKDANDLDKKASLIYIIPLFALACIALAVLGMKNILFVAIMGLASGIISIVGFFKIMTTDMSSMVVQISIENGLWLTLWAYMAIFMISVAWVITARNMD